MICKWKAYSCFTTIMFAVKASSCNMPFHAKVKGFAIFSQYEIRETTLHRSIRKKKCERDSKKEVQKESTLSKGIQLCKGLIIKTKHQSIVFLWFFTSQNFVSSMTLYLMA